MIELPDPLPINERYISGTDIAAILGWSPYSSQYDIWLKRKYGISNVIDPENQARVQYGLECEDRIARRYGLMTGTKVYKVPKYRKIGFFGGSPDRLVSYGSDRWGLEVKTTSRPYWDEVPIYYEMQCRWYMMLYQFDRWDLIVEDVNKHLKIYTITRDHEFEKFMIQEATDFYNRFLLGDQIPVNVEIRKQSDNLVYSDEIDGLYDEYQSIKKEEKEIGVRLTNLKTKIKGLIAENLGVQGEKYKFTWNTRLTSKIDDVKMINDYNIDVSKYTSFKESRVLKYGRR